MPVTPVRSVPADLNIIGGRDPFAILHGPLRREPDINFVDPGDGTYFHRELGIESDNRASKEVGGRGGQRRAAYR